MILESDPYLMGAVEIELGHYVCSSQSYVFRLMAESKGYHLLVVSLCLKGLYEN